MTLNVHVLRILGAGVTCLRLGVVLILSNHQASQLAVDGHNPTLPMVPHAFLAPPFVKSRISLSKAVEYVIGLYLWNSVAEDLRDGLQVSFLAELGDEVVMGWRWLGHIWDRDDPAARFPS